MGPSISSTCSNYDNWAMFKWPLALNVRFTKIYSTFDCTLFKLSTWVGDLSIVVSIQGGQQEGGGGYLEGGGWTVGCVLL